ncbi:MJ0042-type zinc finger domain-containing protein [Rickettsia gravesii]|uniref:MJ0042-type zinc finger domain-containing protein n=1 Tax=Rickettsia gravesii TaxID=354585 RepID=UPI000360246E|nr:MJ0042-type zinc finger domain-containing protein [Rickettsia gravesii]
MYITCPNCQTRFIVTSNQIGINGRRVKCSKCSHLWYQKLDYNTSTLNDFKDKVNMGTIKTPIKNHYNANVPVILPYIPPKKKYNIFPILWTSFIIFCLVILLIDSFKFLGKYDQLKIEEINLGKSRHIDCMKIFYKLSNESDYLISDPIIKVRVMDTNNQALDEYVSITKLQTKIPAKQAIYLEMNIEGIPITAKYIDIVIGNRLGLLFK